MQANHGKKTQILNLCLVVCGVRLFRVGKVCESGGEQMLVLSRKEGESIEFRDLDVSVRFTGNISLQKVNYDWQFSNF